MVPVNVVMVHGAGSTGIAVRKEKAIESEPYRRLVAQLPCMWCGIEGYSQHAHLNYGNGLGLKTDDRTGFPLCRNLACRAQVWSSPRLPTQRDELQVLLMEARNMLTRGLITKGVL